MLLTTFLPTFLASRAQIISASSEFLPPGGGCQKACEELYEQLQDRVSMPDSAAYRNEEMHYWSNMQGDQKPTCRVTPRCSLDASVALRTLRANNCQFAVKSGGHASFAGASNIGPGGVAIDLGGLVEVGVSPDRKIAQVGAGKLWVDLYKYLDPQGLSAIGGRSGGIGVGGLTLGGGISFFSGRYGWACDNVYGYEVILADGEVRYVTYQSDPDLYFALRGGGNNFGLVTRFDLEIIEQGDMWGGQVAYSAENISALNKGLYWFNINHHKDPDAALIVAYVYVPSEKIFVASCDLEYSKPQADPPIFDNFTRLPNLSSTSRITNMTSLAVELNDTQPAGFRETFWTFTTRNDVEIMAELQHLFACMIPDIEDADGLLPALVFQPISTAMTAHFASKGGNALGITLEDGPLILVDISIAWTNISDDERILKFAADFIDKGVDMAKKRNVDFRYVYQNYAAIQQDVFRGYGEHNYNRLKTIHQKYDPTGVFTKLQPGYFKI